MSIEHLSYVMCDGCGNPAEAVSEGHREARRAARAERFVRIDGNDWCPDCASVQPREQEKEDG